MNTIAITLLVACYLTIMTFSLAALKGHPPAAPTALALSLAR
jgi:hypothetical protein